MTYSKKEILTILRNCMSEAAAEHPTADEHLTRMYGLRKFVQFLESPDPVQNVSTAMSRVS